MNADPKVFRFAEQSSPVFTLYTWGLRESPVKIQATASWMRIGLTLRRLTQLEDAVVVDEDVLLGEEPVDNYGFSDSPVVTADLALVDLPPDERGAAYLAWLHSVMVRVARARGWDAAPLEYARNYCLERGLVAHFASARRQSPDRRHKAVLTLDIEADGWRRLAITVTDRLGEVVRRESKLWRPFYFHVYEWQQVRSKFGWTSDRVVTAPGMLPLTVDLDAAPVPDPAEELPIDARSLDPEAGRPPEAVAFHRWRKATGGTYLDWMRETR